MCPISATVQLLIVIFVAILTFQAIAIRAAKIKFTPENVTLHMYDTVQVDYVITEGDNKDIHLYSQNENVAQLENDILLKNSTAGSFNLTGNFLGQTVIRCKGDGSIGKVDGSLNVIVIRKVRAIDKVFHISVAILVSILYINFGCALNYGELIKGLKKPSGPIIGIIGQFLIMPLASFALGKLIFPDNPEMQLGMFFTGVSPAGGASNVWTAVLDGNINLSITMTTISTFLAFGMMPLWIFTLGKLIFDDANMEIPYTHIFTFAVCLIVPLTIGYLMSIHTKRVAKFLARILKTFSSLLILFIIIFAIITNLYLFELFSWRIVLAGMGLPYMGYLLAYILATVLKQPPPDRLAISIETGIQNTGISIFLLRYALPAPQADLTTVAPVAVAIMTPFPLMFYYLYLKIASRLQKPKHEKFAVLDIPDAIQTNMIENTPA